MASLLALAACSGGSDSAGTPGGSGDDGGTGADGAAGGGDGAADQDADKPVPVVPATHFEATEVSWTVPASPGISEGFFNASGFASNWSWATFDIDGDKRPDLVWTADPSHVNPESVWGGGASPYWKVFKNTGAGFSTTASTWTVPVSTGIADGFFNPYGFASNWSWSTFDIDGDEKPDLVWTADPAHVSPDWVWGAAASPYWKVFKNTGAGFSTTATTWTVPASPGIAGGFFNPNGFASDWSWSTFDIDGDERPDLVWTADPTKVSTKSIWGGAASPHWKVFKNTGSGFSTTAVEWSVPVSTGIDEGFYNTNGFASDWSWTTVDIDGDRKPDLVWSADPSHVNPESIWGGAASPHWKVFKNTGSGFATTAMEWSVPASTGIDEGFFNPYGFASDWSWSTADMDGDGRLDFVWTADPAHVNPESIWGGNGSPHWKVFRGVP